MSLKRRNEISPTKFSWRTSPRKRPAPSLMKDSVVNERLKRNLDIDSTTTNSAIEESLSASAVQDIEFESATTKESYTE